MSAMTTFAPASASAVAMPRPMPEAAPVTMAVLPEISIREGPFGSSEKVAAGVDDHRLAGHRLGAAHGDHMSASGCPLFKPGAGSGAPLSRGRRISMRPDRIMLA